MSFYGDFLVQLGVIQEDQLQAALAEQREGRLRLGELAVSRGIMTADQVAQVRQVQRGHESEQEELRFGELAVALGFAAQDEFDRLHREQRAGWRRVGDILVQQGSLDEATHSSYLRDFLHLEMTRSRRLQNTLAEAPSPRVIEALVDLARRWLPRFGLTDAKVMDVRVAPRATPGVAWTAHRSLRGGDVEVIIFFGISQAALMALAQSTERPAKPERPDLALPALEEALETLTELMRSRLTDLQLDGSAVFTVEDNGYRALAELMAERDLVQIELVHSLAGHGTSRAVLTVVTRDGEG
ncbi:MAG: hypothetical protein H6742_09800 [Alphaproteobacteria bacterium]|nr:hypothetical protein [Alphaproteobacteria bacterium]